MVRNVLLVILVLFAINTTTYAQNERDRIKVINVTHQGELTNGEETLFHIVVKYQLVSKDSATLMIGFNNNERVSQMKMIDQEFKTVRKGEGEAIFNITTAVKDWGNEGDFQLHVNLSESPLPKGKFQPLAGDRYILIAEKW